MTGIVPGCGSCRARGRCFFVFGSVVFFDTAPYNRGTKHKGDACYVEHLARYQPRPHPTGGFRGRHRNPKGSKKKYELDKSTGLIILDRVLYTSTHYPANYGFIPRTYGDDGDPLDVLVVCSESIDPMTLVRCYPIGYISMLDGGKNDEKIIAIPFSDPTYNNVQDLMDLPPHLFDEMAHFFSVYKALEGKETVAKDVNDRAAAVEVIRKAMEHYAECFLGGPKAKEELKKSPAWSGGEEEPM